MSCPVCSRGPVRPALHVRGAEVLECGDCGLRFWRPAPGFRPGTLYDAAYFASCEAERGYDDYASLESSLRRTFARRLRALPPPRDGARLLDVGAAFGFAVAEARRAGWRAVGLEVSPAAARRAAAVGPGVQIVGDAARLPFPAACFEALTLWDVIEHLPDPHAAVAEAARVLRPGGRLALTTGDVGSLVARLSGARWHLYTLPEHLFFHTRESLRRLVAAHGLRVLRLRADAAWYTLGYLAERLRKTLLPRGAKRPARWPGARLAVPVNLFDVVTLEALRE